MSGEADRDSERRHAATTGFREAFGRDPAAIAFAPGRVNLIGEHTDYNGGLVLPMAIDLGTTCAVAPRADDVVRVTSMQRDGIHEALLDDAAGLRGTWPAYAVGAHAVARERGWAAGGLDVWLDGEVPLGAGLSSSASLECAVLTAVLAAHGQAVCAGGLDPMEVALAAQEAEHAYAGVPCGVMDQAAAMLGRQGHAVLLDCATLQARPIPLDLDAMGLSILLLNTNVRHDLADGAYADRRASCERAAAALGVTWLSELGHSDLGRLDSLPDPDARRARHVITENARVRATVRAFAEHDRGGIAGAFAGSQRSMAHDFEVTCPEVDLAVEAAVAGGAVAARMTGGGFGGCVVTVVDLAAGDEVAAAVAAAFAHRGYAPPTPIVVEPADGARVLLP